MVRAKFRYTVVSVIPVSKKLESESFSVKHSDLYRTIILMIKKMHGDFGLAAIKTGFAAKYCNDLTKVAIVKTRHGPHRFVTTVIPLIKNIGNVTIHLQTLRTTSTLRQAYKFLKRYQQLHFERISQSYKEQDNLALLEKRCLDLKPVIKMMTREPREA